MNRSENEVGRASGVVNTATREAMAREKARALGPKVRRPSALEEAAVQWEREREVRTRRAEEERLEMSRQGEALPFSLQRVSLPSNGSEAEYEVGWKTYIPPKPKGNRRPRRIGHIPVMSMARQVIQRERARGGGSVVMDPRARALEAAARSWEAQQTTGNNRR